MRQTVLILGLLTLAAPAGAIVSYDEGAMVIEGVQLLRDMDDENAYYYLPQYPRLATKADGETLEFLCMKYVGRDGVANGGLFHALFEFSLPEEIAESVARRLRQRLPDAELKGPVPLMQAVEDGEGGMGGFQIVSATLSDTGEEGFTRQLISSGRAPLAPGSKAVIAARLSQDGATLLWETLSSPTSDVSVALRAYYEAAVRGYNARVTADVSTVYEHLSQRARSQREYTLSDVRSVVDELERAGDIQVEVLDRSQSLGLDVSEMDRMLGIITDRLTQLMFDTEAGWSRTPKQEAAASVGATKGRMEQGWLTSALGIVEDTRFYTDTRFVLKNRRDIQQNTFSINLSRSTTIRVPLDTAGNLGGLYEASRDDSRYFRVVNLEDSVFETRDVLFQLDGSYLDAFKSTINFVTVNFRKRYTDQPEISRSLVFNHDDVTNGRTLQEVSYPRLGAEEADWRDYEYQLRWSVRDRPTIAVPSEGSGWMRSEDPAVSLVPPFRRTVIEIDADRRHFDEHGVRAAIVEFNSTLAGEPYRNARARLRAADAESTTRLALFHDRDAEVTWHVTWHTRAGARRQPPQKLEGEYLLLMPPEDLASRATENR